MQPQFLQWLITYGNSHQISPVSMKKTRRLSIHCSFRLFVKSLHKEHAHSVPHCYFLFRSEWFSESVPAVPDLLVVLVVMASASRVAEPRFDSCLRRWDSSGSSHTSDLKTGTPVATLPGAWCYRVSAGTGWPGVTTLWLGEVERKIFWADPSLRYTSMLLGRWAANKLQPAVSLSLPCIWTEVAEPERG